MVIENDGAERDVDDQRMQHQGIGFLAPAGAERPRDRRRDAAPHGAGGDHLHQHHGGKDQRHAGERLGAEPRHEPGLDQPGRGLRQHHQHIGPGHAQQGRHDRPVEQHAGARVERGGGVAASASGSWGGGEARAARLIGRSACGWRAALRRGDCRQLGARARAGGRPRRIHIVGLLERPPGRTVDQYRVGRHAGLGIDQQHARALGREVLVAPGQERDDHRAEIAAACGKHIFVPRRMLAVAPPLHELRLDQRVETARQHGGGDAQALLELVEAREAMQRVAQDQDAPPLADALQAAGDRAGHVAEALVLH